ncbi:CBO0543 family protein [Bacillus taeanensis]|uniref:Uncharacterized protein n=1 Tax=Bacillus taeanensis TaxID=273032 RepID=A0A366XNZ0_9BACI|nr:CBO0543 family protein [Bacillus taeanensis]RBW67832.1 hypothetical protein DS031_20005 [Bacillus taeanensis]
MNPPKIYKEELNKVFELMNKAQTLKWEVWQEYVIFTAHWWAGIFLTIIPWILWIFFHKKESTNRMLFVGFFIMLISSFLDFLGVRLGLWLYYYDIIPFIPAYFPWDCTLIPVLVMFFIEVKPKTNPLLKALLFGSLTAFVAEPLFEFVGLYKPLKWEHIYSFPIFTSLYLIAHFLSKRKNFQELVNK